MPLYELVCIARQFPSRDLSKIKQIVKQSALHILDNGGVVKQIQYLGTKRLPYRMRKGKEIHDHGIFWTLKFYSNSDTMTGTRKILEFDQNVVKQSIVKIGSSLSDYVAKSN